MERIDKIISSALNISRNDARAFIKRGAVIVNSACVKSIGEKIDEKSSEIFCNGERVVYQKYVYIMMNKPKGIISASQGAGEKTVVDILPAQMKRKNLFPAGRLDKETTGFMLITDDGEFAHNILSPKNHVPKTYIAKLDKPFSNEMIDAFKRGVKLKEDECMPALLEPAGKGYLTARVTIKQGMYHQIKRMFAAFSITVTELERIKIGDLCLDEKLLPGECRYITPDELDMIKKDK